MELCPVSSRRQRPAKSPVRNIAGYSVVDKVSLHRLMDAVQIPGRVSTPIIERFYLWLKQYGPEWTVERLKCLKTVYLQHHAGNHTFRQELPGLSFHKDGSPRGAFHALWTMGSSYRVVNKVFSVLMSYSSIIIVGRPTRKQWKKFHDAVTCPRPSGDLPEWEERDAVLELFHIQWGRARYDEPTHWVSSPTKFVTSFHPLKGTQKVRECDLPLDAHIADFMLFCNPLLQEHSTKQLLAMLFQDFQLFHWEASLSSLHHTGVSDGEAHEIIVRCTTRPLVGHIGIIQERGCKLRAVANPLRVIQIALSRLKNMLEGILRKLPWDCTHEQEAGIRWAQEMLREGHVLFAFDLSNASDTIPLQDQLAMLRSLGPIEDWEFEAAVKLFENVSRGDWLLPKQLTEDSYLSWTKGQGLGVGCSFGAFALAHGLRLREIELKAGVSNAFVVLGDDVIVRGDIAYGYHHFVTRVWGCDISEPKTITSGLLTEFASRVVTGHKNYKSFKYPKSPRLFETFDPLSLLIKYGKRAIKLVPSRMRPTVQVISSLPKPVGLGWKWPERELLLPDPKGSENILVPNKREQVPDILPVEIFRRERKQFPDGRKYPGARYDSVVVRSKSLVEREQDLAVAFQSMAFKPGVELASRLSNSGFQSSLLAEEAGLLETTPTSTGSSDDFSNHRALQWAILHLNACRDVDTPQLRELHAFVEKACEDLDADLDSRNELKASMKGASPLTNEKNIISLFEKKIELWCHITTLESLYLYWVWKLGIFIEPRNNLLERELKRLPYKQPFVLSEEYTL